MGRILDQVANVDPSWPGSPHEAAEGIRADPANESRLPAEPGNAHRHVGRCATRTLEVVLLPFRDQVHYRIPITHTRFVTLLLLHCCTGFAGVSPGFWVRIIS